MDLTESQRRFLKSADSDGRVFVGRRASREVEELIEGGYLEQNLYNGDYYWVRKVADGQSKKR